MLSGKYMNFLAMAWFISTVICLTLEGSFFGATENSIINDLSIITTINIADTVTIPCFNLMFFRGVIRLLMWDYSFYEGGWFVVRIFWMVVLSSGAVWGIGSAMVSVFANFLRVW